MPVWHASVALVRNCKLPKAAKAWSAWEKAEAWAIAQELLKDGDIAIHLRRRLSHEELALLSPAWLAIPAVDEA